MRYYIYVSPAKVEMLFAQIPSKLLSKIAAKFAIDLKLLKAEISSQQPQETLFSKVNVVLDYLDQNDFVGSVDHPKGYFRGQLALRWGPYGHGTEKEGAVYFGGRTRSTILGLGGSFSNVIGNVGASPAHSHSATPSLLAILYKELNLDSGSEIESLAGGLESSFQSNRNSMALAAVELASLQMEGPEQQIEFVARKLLWSDDAGIKYDWAGRTRGMKVLLGTPIYAALAE